MDATREAGRKAVWLFVLNLALLGTHEIDSAYWHEWAMFRLPGGLQLFLVLNLALLLVFLAGLVRLAEGSASGPWFSLGLAITGVLAFGIHLTFLVLGRPEFRLAASLGVLGLILPISLAQAWSAIKLIRESG